jgi:16S rRNA (guanine527-N7)-methyltransferase
VDKAQFILRLREGALQLGVTLSAEMGEQFFAFSEQLQKWNRKINLTAITDSEEILEKHFLDSLAPLPTMRGGTLLDLGTGAGFPGIPLKLARPDLAVTLVDSSVRKVAFLKSALLMLGVKEGVRAIAARAEGYPEVEGIPKAAIVVSRALQEPREWIRLAESYVEPGGEVVAMLGPTGAQLLAEIASRMGMVPQMHPYFLPFSHANRVLAVFRFERDVPRGTSAC